MTHNGPVDIRPASLADVDTVADLAARTFPLACPDHMTDENISAFIAANLNAAAFAGFVSGTEYTLSLGTIDGEIRGYLLLVDEGDVQFISKCYVDEHAHGSGLAALLMNDAIATARARGAHTMRLGVNRHNERATAFYTRHGFEIVGTRMFTVGDQVENDYVLERSLIIGSEISENSERS